MFSVLLLRLWTFVCFFFNDPATTEIYTLSLHDALPISTRRDGDDLVMEGLAEGNRARLKGEAVAGLAGQPLSEGLPGQWIQPYWLWLTAHDAGGSLDVQTGEGRVILTARMPN